MAAGSGTTGAAFRGPRHLDDRQFYRYTDWTHNDEVYISGNIFCVNRHLLLDHPFDESLGHMQEEDLEWSRRYCSVCAVQVRL
jgi:hypothetical protein